MTVAYHIRTIPCLILPILLAWQIGCTSAPQHRAPMQLDESVRTQLGRIGVIALADPPTVALNVPPKGWTGGARRAAEIGSVYGGATTGVLACLPSGVLAGVLCPVLYFVGYIPGAGIGALIGAPLGAMLAEPVATVEQVEDSFITILADRRIPELLRETVVQLIHEQTPYDIVRMAVGESVTQNQETDYRSFADNGISTILELKVMAAGLCGDKELSFNPLLAVCMTVRSRLIRASEGTVLDERIIAFDEQIANDRVSMQPLGDRKTFTHWAANNGQLFQDELTRTAKSLAEKTVEELFLLSPANPAGG